MTWCINPQDLQLISLALAEDLGPKCQDLTTDLLFAKKGMTISTAHIISKQPTPIVMCGAPLVAAILQQAFPHCSFQSHYAEGETLLSDTILLSLQGPISDLLKVERCLLNFLQRLCGIATLTAQFTACIAHTACQVLDTRKTLPGFRHLDKYAVHCGGGSNHRMGLYDAIMIKDTHIDALGGITQALAGLPEHIPQDYPVIVEVRNEQELEAVLAQASTKISRVLLDNLSITQLYCCVQRCQAYQLSTEASGNVTRDTIARIAETGVNFVSVGQLTHSAPSVDLSMRIL